jgi:error-prone DNA polymerase
MFVTLEDETGNVNVIVWPSLPEKQRREALSASLLAVYGTWQCEGEVRHLVLLTSPARDVRFVGHYPRGVPA